MTCIGSRWHGRTPCIGESSSPWRRSTRARPSSGWTGGSRREGHPSTANQSREWRGSSSRPWAERARRPASARPVLTTGPRGGKSEDPAWRMPSPQRSPPSFPVARSTRRPASCSALFRRNPPRSPAHRRVAQRNAERTGARPSGFSPPGQEPAGSVLPSPDWKCVEMPPRNGFEARRLARESVALRRPGSRSCGPRNPGHKTTPSTNNEGELRRKGPPGRSSKLKKKLATWAPARAFSFSTASVARARAPPPRRQPPAATWPRPIHSAICSETW